MPNSNPSVNSLWFGTNLKKFVVVKLEDNKVFYRPFDGVYKVGEPEYHTNIDAFKHRFSPFLPKKRLSLI